MNPLSDAFEAALFRRVFKWIMVFFVLFFFAGLTVELQFLTQNGGNRPHIAVLRGGILAVNVLITLWAFRSTMTDEAFLRFPPAVIALNFVFSTLRVAMTGGSAVIGAGAYLVQANLYIICFSFFVRHQGATLTFGGILLAGAITLFQLSAGTFFALPYDEAMVLKAYSYILFFGVVATTVLIAFNNRLAAIVIARIHEHGEEMRRIALTDQVTALPNGLALARDMKAWEELPVEKRTPRFLMIGFRLDGLEGMNEIHGLEFTNKVVSELAGRYRRALEQAAARFPLYGPLEGFSTLYRIEGNTFVFLTKFPDHQRSGQGAPILKNILKEMGGEYRESISLSFQGGYTVYPDDAESTEQLFRNLLNLIHGRRREDTGIFVGFDEDRYREHMRRESLRESISKGIAEGELSVVYQPKVSCAGEKVEGFEALSRWNSPRFGPVSPGEFIPLAEEAGDIAELTDFVVERSIGFLKRLSEEGHGDVTVSVNLSPGTVHLSYLRELAACVEQSGLGDRLEFEITEGIIMKMTGDILLEFDRLRQLGVRFSIDDFGTGYSNLGYLQNFDAQVLKIDKRFIDGIPLDDKNAKLVAAILQIARSFGMHTVAEGVEYAEQMRFLREQGCDAIQGYFFSKPLNLDSAIAFCRGKGGS